MDTVDEPRRLAEGRTALVVVDLQNDFCDPAGAYARAGHDLDSTAHMVGQVRLLIDAAEGIRLPILFTRLEYPLDDSGTPLSMTWRRDAPKALGNLDPRLGEGSWGAELIASLPRPDGSSVIVKHAYSAFFGTRLDPYLARRGIENVILCGLASNGCLMHTAFDAHVRGYRVVIPWDATASYWPELHSAAFRILDNMVADVCSTEELVSELSSLDSANGERR